MQQSLSTRRHGVPTGRTCLSSSSPHRLPPLRQPQLARLEPGTACIPTGFCSVKKTPAARTQKRKVSTSTLRAPPLMTTPSTGLCDFAGRLEHTFNICTEDVTTAAVDESNIAALSSELVASRAEVASLQAALRSEDRQVELLRSTVDCHKFAMADTYHRLQERDELAVSLELRLLRLRSNRKCLDLENDPLIERDARAIVKDAYVTKLHRENAALLQSMHRLQLQLETLSAGSKL